MIPHTQEAIDDHKRATGTTPMPPAMRKAFDREYPEMDSYRSWYEEGVEWALTWLTRHGPAVQTIEAALTALEQTDIRHMSRREIVEVVLATAPAATAAARDVLAERQRQIEAEGWTPAHDDAHGAGELSRAGGLYASNAGVAMSFGTHDTSVCDTAPYGWPWCKSWWKPTTVRRDLVKAGALILAEIERLDRAAEREGE